MSRKLYNTIGFILILIFFAIVGLGMRIVFMDVHGVTLKAKQEYNTTSIHALKSLIKDESQAKRKRNKAVWALGQIGSDSDVEFLSQQLKLENNLDKYELKKAKKHCSGFTLTLWMFRNHSKW